MILGIQELEKELQNMSEAELRSGIASGPGRGKGRMPGT